METSTEAQSTRPPKGAIESASGMSWVWIVAFSGIATTWGWGAFVRGRGNGRGAQLLVVATIVVLIAGLLRIAWNALARRGAILASDRPGLLVFSASAFLLLAVFLPEYVLGKPQVLVRSFVLLGLCLALFASYIRIVADRTAEPSPSLSPRLALFGLCAIYFAATTYVTLAKLHAYGYVGQDIAYFTQCLYTTLHGDLLYSNMYHDLLYGKPVYSDLAGHNQLVLFLFVPFYAAHKAASTMLVVRNLSIVLCAWPVHKIARRFLSPWMAVTTAMAFLLMPAVLYQNFYDFAPLSLAGLPLLFALNYFLEGRFWPYLIALVAAQIVREDLVFAVFGLGLLGLWQRRSLRWVAVPCAFALLWAALSWKVIFPHFLQGATSAVASCFSYLGVTPGAMLGNLLHHPRAQLTHDNLVYIKQMVDPLGGVLFLLSPAWLISLPYIAINVLGQGGGCNTAIVYRHYSLIPAVFLFGGVLLALKNMGSRSGTRITGPALRSAIVLFMLMASMASVMLVTGQQQFADMETRPWHDEAKQVAAMLPSDAAVAVPRYMLPSVANRMSLYQSLRLLEYHHPDARYIVIDKDWQRMAATAQWRSNYEALRQLLETTPEYSVMYNSPNYVIYKLCDGCAPRLPHRDPGIELHE
jgi:uncharacterized membrane protein